MIHSIPENITYLGYTQDHPGHKPTLYFKEGRLTQEHPTYDSKGWHPVTSKYFHAVNITPEAAKKLLAIPKNDPGESVLANEIVQNKHLDETQYGLFCECSSNDHQTWSVHISRSRFIAVTSRDANPEFDAAYAHRALKSFSHHTK